MNVRYSPITRLGLKTENDRTEMKVDVVDNVRDRDEHEQERETCAIHAQESVTQ